MLVETNRFQIGVFGPHTPTLLRSTTVRIHESVAMLALRSNIDDNQDDNNDHNDNNDFMFVVGPVDLFKTLKHGSRGSLISYF